MNTPMGPSKEEHARWTKQKNADVVHDAASDGNGGEDERKLEVWLGEEETEKHPIGRRPIELSPTHPARRA
jgi:hypothetical protein